MKTISTYLIFSLTALVLSSATAWCQTNQAPVITGQASLTVEEGSSLEITLDHLQVTDPDDVYPDDFTLSVAAGPNYTVDQTVVTANPGFTGVLSIPVTVNDGEASSEPFDLAITVTARPADNVAPIITSQSEVRINEGESFTVTFAILTVEDPDNTYPDGFTLNVSNGTNYAVDGTTITPTAGFSGTLSVPVLVNDGIDDSNTFPLTVTVEPAVVENVRPTIVGQRTLSTVENTSITLQFSDLTVEDPDNNYPDGFTMTVGAGANYTFNGHTITPSAGFTGTLSVSVTVNDGKDSSDPFNVAITVTPAPVENIPPVITGQRTLTTGENTPLTLAFSDLTVNDPDDAYPAGFTMTLTDGANYTVSGRTITPATNFSGTLTVPVTINDGEDSSAPFNVTITVTQAAPVNTKPVITGQVPLSTEEAKPIGINLQDLIVSDPDDSYPSDFTLSIYPGQNYSITGKNVKPDDGFTGTLKVRVTVNDGTVDSDPFNVSITVVAKAPVNTKPVITGQVSLSMLNTETLTILLSYLTVTDPDNAYPGDFTIQVLPGDNYSVTVAAVKPNAGFTGTLSVRVTVNDGQATSDPFDLKISVQPPAQNVRPTISGQQELTTFVNTNIALRLTHLIVSDPDNDFPDDFTMSVSSGPNYTVSGNTIKPANGFRGTLSVPVRVNDGTSDSDLFTVIIAVIEKNELRIVGQRELITKEDSLVVLSLEDLQVNDPSGKYPDGFTLAIGQGGDYLVEGNVIRPAANFSGTLQVPVTVRNSAGASNPFNLVILVLPVNDAPTLEGSSRPLEYSMGSGPASVDDEIIVNDPDDERLVFAEVTIDQEQYLRGKETLIATSASDVRSIFDPNTGTIVLLGTASIAEYQNVLRGIQYQFNGDTLPRVLSKKILFRVNDGLTFSEWYSVTIQLTELVKLDVPNVFTPNGDLKNDEWVITRQTLSDNIIGQIRVFDQRGVMVYESFTIEQPWDGRSNGKTLPSGTYYYSIDISAGANSVRSKGTVTILR
jgi:gliding motility-associated-like protein